jgi:predicted metal-dependent phosphoesterase TrpH
MIDEAKKRGIRYLAGVEVAATLQGKEHHITCYGGSLEDVQLQALLGGNRKTREDGNEDMIRHLAASDSRVDPSQFQDYSYERVRGGWSSLNYLLDVGVVRDLPHFFELLHPLGITTEFRHPADVIQVLHNAGCVVILAHPSAYTSESELPVQRLAEWIEYGIDGVECYTPYNDSPVVSKFYVSFCYEKELLVSGGSDCHGPFLTRELGVPCVTSDMIDAEFIVQGSGGPGG